jgi:UDP-glucose 4-epimerase
MRCLVTGGAGFIGSHVAAELLATGHDVVTLDDLSGGFDDNVPAGATLVRGSVTDHGLVDRLFAERDFEAVYHLAAYAAEGLSPFIRRFNYQNNLIGSVNLINASVNHGVRCFVFTSSIAVYGSGQTPMSEAMPPAPEDPYGIAKAAVEQDLAAARKLFGLNTVIFRPHNVYGERQNIGDRYRNVIGIFMNQLMRGEPLTVFGDGEQTRAFSYIGEVAPIIARAATTPGAFGEIFNIGADTPCTVNELASEVCRVWGVAPVITHLEQRHEVVHAHANHDKVRCVFGAPERAWTLREGLERMAAWAKRHGARESARFTSIEITKNLPPRWR